MMYYTLTKKDIENNAGGSFQGADFWRNITINDLNSFKLYNPQSIYTLDYYLQVTTRECPSTKKWNKRECLNRALEIYSIWHER